MSLVPLIRLNRVNVSLEALEAAREANLKHKLINDRFNRFNTDAEPPHWQKDLKVRLDKAHKYQDYVDQHRFPLAPICIIVMSIIILIV